MKCDVVDWGSKNFLLHMYYPATDKAISGTESILNHETNKAGSLVSNKMMLSAQSDYFKYKANP